MPTIMSTSVLSTDSGLPHPPPPPTQQSHTDNHGRDSPASGSSGNTGDLVFTGLNFKNLIRQMSGSWDGTGLLDWIKELIDNSCDQGPDDNNFTDKYVNVYTKNNTQIICEDNMAGILQEGLIRLLTFYTDNNERTEKTIGKFGIGAKKAILALSNLLNESEAFNSTESERKVIVIGKQGDHYVSTEISYTESETLPLYIEQFKNNLKTDSEAQSLWKKHSSYSDCESGTVIVIQTSTEMVDTFKNEMSTSKNIFNLSETYKQYLKHHLTIKINNIKIPYFKKDITNNYLYKKYTYNSSNTRIKWMYTDDEGKKQCIKWFGRGYSKKFVENKSDDGGEFLGSIDITLTLLKAAFIHTPTQAGYDPKIIDSNFKDLVTPYFPNLDDFDLENLYNDKTIKVRRVMRTLGTFDTSYGRPKGHNLDEVTYDAIHKELSYKSKMDTILGITQQNKSNINLKGSVPCIDRVVGLLVEEFRKTIVKEDLNSQLAVIQAEAAETEDVPLADDNSAAEDEYVPPANDNSAAEDEYVPPLVKQLKEITKAEKKAKKTAKAKTAKKTSPGSNKSTNSSESGSEEVEEVADESARSEAVEEKAHEAEAQANVAVVDRHHFAETTSELPADGAAQAMTADSTEDIEDQFNSFNQRLQPTETPISGYNRMNYHEVPWHTVCERLNSFNYGGNINTRLIIPLIKFLEAGEQENNSESVATT
jgi:hypothetical protein